MTSEEKHTPLSDTIHNLNVVRDALEAEGLTVHVKLIDQAIEDICAAAQAVQLPPIPIHWARPNGDTFDEMRDNVWKTGLATVGDTILIWVNEGDFLHAQIVFGAVEYPQLSHNTQAASAWRPIDTAPKDGTEILAYWSPAVEMGESATDITCWLQGSWTNPEDVEARYIDPTHWMPLPAPPLSRPPCGPTEKTEGDQS